MTFWLFRKNSSVGKRVQDLLNEHVSYQDDWDTRTPQSRSSEICWACHLQEKWVETVVLLVSHRLTSILVSVILVWTS